MSLARTIVREAKFAIKERSVFIWFASILCLSSIAIGFGLAEVDHQKREIQHLIDSDEQDRIAVRATLKDWGSAAYYSFHLTYDPPSDFAFAAMGLRDSQPWKHRIRMLALEGQIYERDVGNPSLALIGRFDFAFLVAFIIPLVLIILLYDLRTSEKIAGRHDLLEATSKRPLSLWFTRASLRATGVFVCLILPLFVGGAIAGTKFPTIVLASLAIFSYVAFWTLICFVISSWSKPSSTIMMVLIAIWVSTAVLLPAGARLIIDRIIPVPSGADILLLQRETVNDAWDLPKKSTMDPFYNEHPAWTDYTPKDDAFDWPWYYAFQQVGDQRAQHLSAAYREGRLRRARIAAWISPIALPSLLERSLQSLAGTDINASIQYEDNVRAYHKSLRRFYYPYLFGNKAFDRSLLEVLPEYKPPAIDNSNNR